MAIRLFEDSEARRRGQTRIWLATTNDNLRAINFHQRFGFRLTEVHAGVVDEARKIKPEIPEVGKSGIPIHDVDHGAQAGARIGDVLGRELR